MDGLGVLVYPERFLHDEGTRGKEITGGTHKRWVAVLPCCERWNETFRLGRGR